MNKLPDLLARDTWDIYAIVDAFNQLLIQAVALVNAEFGPKRLAKSTREVEPLPTDTRQLSSYCTRIGTMLEYAISTAMTQLIEAAYGGRYLLTFATAHEYPDFYFRDDTMSALLRIEMKAVDAESDEQAARFSTPTAWIDPDRDMLLLVAWKWEDLRDAAGEVVGEYPYIFAGVVLPAGEIARERDIRLSLTGGKIEGEEVYVYSSRQEAYVPDPGNYGKFWRIVHTTRRDSDELNVHIQKFRDFLRVVNEMSPRNRFG